MHRINYNGCLSGGKWREQEQVKYPSLYVPFQLLSLTCILQSKELLTLKKINLVTPRVLDFVYQQNLKIGTAIILLTFNFII